MDDFRPDDATRAQIDAANPGGSVWLGANAGSGKTRVLTNRVAWLLLDGAAPERILCLTFTRAAAAEMQNRLSETLGAWAMLPDDALRDALTKLGVPRGRIDSDGLRRARTLFARAIETPGGLKIQTIHAFCASLLRRFPLEAGVTPAFREMDETNQRHLLSDVLDAMAEDPADAPLIKGLAELLTASDPRAFLSEIARLRDRLATPADEARLRSALGVMGDSRAEVMAWAIDGDALDLVERMRDAANATGQASMDKLGAKLAQAVLADDQTRYALIRDALLTQTGEPRKSPLTKPALQAMGGDEATGDIASLAETVQQTEATLRAHDALDRARLLHAFAPRYLARLQAEKDRRGWLDYDDLVSRARDLLSRRETAQWVLYKLDGGIDHVLVDEAQDTSQVQWDVIAAITGEFGGGQGARDAHRTLFVVGDRKQSIFSFQGADPAAFDGMRTHLGQALQGGAEVADHALRHSFRSSPAILDVVDGVFGTPSGAGEPTTHIAFNADLPGRVDLWTPIPEPEAPVPRDWTDPIDRPAQDAAHVQLARKIARTIKRAIKAGTPVVSKGRRRAMQPRDVLILFRARDKLFDAVIGACKAAGLEMAGADRLRLTGELAVRDLLSLCRFAATPEDDLSLAEVLRSPLGGLSEAELFAVAHNREASRPLWRAVAARPEHATLTAMLEDLMAQADFLRPFELLQRILIHHDGRRRMLGRLGDQSAEAIDGLLHQALAYEALEVPSLTGFLGWIEEAEIDIKREATGGAIRVMTIHGAKGLEAPVVIVPQCGPRKPKDPAGILHLEGDVPVWRGSKSAIAGPLREEYDAAQARLEAEQDRLLYVALTRAENWLICASAGAEGDGEDWGSRVGAAMQALAAVPTDDGLRLERGDWSPAPAEAMPEAATIDLPPWAEAPAAPRSAAPALLAPSDLGGAKALPGEDGTDRDAAMRFGTRVHLLLEHLPALPPDRWDDAARILIDRHAPPERGEAAEALSAALLTEARAVLVAHGDVVFAPGTLAEMPFVLPPSDASPGLTGTMDRVIVTPDRVRIVDFKSNRAVPPAPEAVPEGLLRQMGAYAAAARAIWPGRDIETAILWTANASLMALPQDLVATAWARAGAH